MTAPIVRLEADGLEPLILDPYAGFVIQSLDLGDAVTRAVAVDAVDADGTDDTTSFVGARNITLAVRLRPLAGSTKEQMRRRLRAFTSPRLRPTMFVTLDDSAEQQVTLRRGAWANLIQHPAFADVVVQWVAPLGILESSEPHQAIANASGGGTEGGRTYDRSGDRAYTGGTVVGATTVTNAGTADAYPLLRVYGPCTDPVIENVTQGKTLAFSGLSVAAGEFVEIDTRAKTIYYQGDPSDSRYDDLDFPASSWWTLSPGDNTIRLNPATYSIPSQLVVEYRDAWL